MSELSTEALASRLVPGRRIAGVAAVLMPFHAMGQPDLDGLDCQLERVTAAGLTPAVNMDTGYVQLLSADQQAEVLAVASRRYAGQPAGFVAGAFVGEAGGSLCDAYRKQIDIIESAGGRPILFPCPRLRALTEVEVVALFETVTRGRQGVLLFELGDMFVPYGRIYSLTTFEALLKLEGVAGLKHSSLDRRAEWDRLEVRDRVRPDFRVYTGNDLAIDMVMYGSDYLLGLSAFYPEAFALRDRWWFERDPRFFAVNDLLQYLGCFAFRPPVPAYRHDAALFLKLRGQIAHDGPPSGAPRRPDSDRAVLEDILSRIETMLAP